MILASNLSFNQKVEIWSDLFHGREYLFYTLKWTQSNELTRGRNRVLIRNDQINVLNLVISEPASLLAECELCFINCEIFFNSFVILFLNLANIHLECWILKKRIILEEILRNNNNKSYSTVKNNCFPQKASYWNVQMKLKVIVDIISLGVIWY